MANSSINLVSLDFDTMRSNLKTYLKAQPSFSDYDFEGSNISVLLDILAYNTFHNAFYMNMVVNESYLDSSQLRNSAVSHAKELNYLPRSARSAKAVVSMTFGSDSNIVTIPKGTSFTTTVGSSLLTFVTESDSVQFSTNGSFTASNISVYEGKYNNERYIVNYNNLNQRFVINDPLVDTRSISVTVIEDNTGSNTTFTATSTTLDLTDTSKIFFIQGIEDGKYEIIFGDGILGRRPKDNSVVSIQYRTCHETDGNGASRFFLDQAFTTFTTTPTVETISVGSGGAAAETIESIKFYAPRYFQIQERAINVTDYEILLKQRFPEINLLSAYGGEDINPPQYGKVFISVDISDIAGLPQPKIDEYTNFIKPRAPISISTQFVEPEFLYYSVESIVKYNVNETDISPEQVKSLVANKIITYHQTNLNDFKASFKYSKFIAAIDDISNAAILSNDTDIKIYKKFIPIIGVNFDLDIAFGVALSDSGSLLDNTYSSDDLVAVSSSTFTYNGESVHIDDNGEGILRLVKDLNNDVVTVLPNIGTVNYNTGDIQLVNMRVDGLPVGEQYIRLYAITEYKDFDTKENIILDIEASLLDISVVATRSDPS